MTEAKEAPSIRLDPRFPPLEDCIPRHVLDRRARLHPERLFVQFEDGTTWTYGQLAEQVRTAAVGLQQLGVRQGQHVVVWLPNGPQALALWFATGYVGAVYVPLNTAFRGRILEHALTVAEGSLIIAHDKLIERLADCSRAVPDLRVVVGGPARDGWRDESAVFRAQGRLAALEREIMPWDLQSIVFTSGTTGPSKGVMQSYLQQHVIASGGGFLSEHDRYLMTLPLYHQGGLTAVNRMFLRGGALVMADGFSTSTFWDMVRTTGATSTTLMGAMAKFLSKAPPSPQDREHTLRSVVIVPLEDQYEFARRFGVDVYSVYNMTELAAPLETQANPESLGTCGRARPGFELRIVDEHDCEVPVGESGELIVRSEWPWALTSGYYKDAQATSHAWRNGWFHTGDCFSRDTEGNYFFRDRLKDAIRRRGENVSALEVEAEIMAHPCVHEAAVVAVPSDSSEDDIMAVVTAAPGQTIDPAELLEFLRPRMAYFMVPRYVRIVPAMPKTPSHKVQKHLLRSEGVTAEVWDREAAGLQIRRERL